MVEDFLLDYFFPCWPYRGYRTHRLLAPLFSRCRAMKMRDASHLAGASYWAAINRGDAIDLFATTVLTNDDDKIYDISPAN
jgi:hypothetical protein